MWDKRLLKNNRSKQALLLSTPSGVAQIVFTILCCWYSDKKVGDNHPEQTEEILMPLI